LAREAGAETFLAFNLRSASSLAFISLCGTATRRRIKSVNLPKSPASFLEEWIGFRGTYSSFGNEGNYTCEKSQTAASLRQEHHFDVFEYAANHIGQLNQKWRDSYTLHRQSFLEKYKNLGLTLICDFQVSMLGERIEGSLGAAKNPHSNENALASVVFKAKINEGTDLQHWKQKPMLVQDIETVQGPEGIIHSFIWLYGIHNETTDCFGGLMYQSTVDCSYKFIPSFSEWKPSEIVVPVKPGENNRVNGKIKRPSEIMKSITDDEGQMVTWEWPNFAVMEDIISRLRVNLTDESVEVTFSECLNLRVEVIDVLLGPLNL
jgi:hypothetical protein